MNKIVEFPVPRKTPPNRNDDILTMPIPTDRAGVSALIAVLRERVIAAEEALDRSLTDESAVPS